MIKEILITSSALILALLVIRQVFRGMLSRRVQYALWALVLVRLLVPVSLPAADFSVLTAAQPVQAAVADRVTAPVFIPVARQPLSQHPTAPDAAPEQAIEPTQDRVWVVRDDETAVQYRRLSAQQILKGVWIAGMAVMGAFFLVSNLGFYLRLRKNREEWQAGGGLPHMSLPHMSLPHSPHKVYLVPDRVIPSPCLFGRSIYITPAVAQDPARLRHVLIHELTHARHLDPLWSLLRCLCLTVYWFDPLVWVAAVCSRTDCELSCDESVLKALGEEERIPYGQTLVSLIPVRRGSNPLLTATTMAAGKKQLKDRITRIARRPRQLVAAALAVAVLAGAVSACTFTGAKVSPAPNPSQGPTESTLRSLAGEELRWFNEQFFNAHPNSPISYTYNIRNQFANPGICYDKPEDIDLYELLYLEGNGIPDDELSIVWDGDPNELPCGAYKLTTAEIDAILTEYTGLTLEQANKESLTFTYDAGHDAWYWMHGDTNYCGDLDFLCGTREGDIVKLYHTSDYAGSSWYCVTLKAQEDGSYWFLSNQKCEAPQIPPSLPAGEPEAVLDLSALEPYIAPTVAVEPHTDDFIDHFEYRLDNWGFDGNHMVVYRSSTQPGTVHAALRQDDGTMNVFFTTQEANYLDTFFFRDLFGRSGFTIAYYGQTGEHSYGTLVDFYTVSADGVPALLCRTGNDFNRPIAIDLDGDGLSELVTERELFFQREGRLYRADLPQLLGQAMPGMNYYWDASAWDKYSKCLVVYGAIQDEKLGGRDCTLLLFFDGERVLVYKQSPKSATDHVVDGAAEQYAVPDQVVADAKDYVLHEVLSQGADGTWRYRDQEADSEYAPVFDDWRIESFTGFYSEQFGDTVIEGWSFNYELHTTTPEKVVLAGGRYITEDDWVSPGYPGCEWLFYRLSGVANENRELLWHDMINDMSTDSWAFKENVISHLDRLGVDLGSTSVASEKVQQALELILDHSDNEAQILLATPDGVGGGSYLAANSYNLANRQLYFTQPDTFAWTEVEPPAQEPTGATLLLADPYWYSQLQFWEGSDLVMSKGNGQSVHWYQARPMEDNAPFESDIFSFMRVIFDEAELVTLQDAIAISDQGQGPLKIVQDFVEQYEGAHLKATPGSLLRFTFMKVGGTGTLEDMPETWFPSSITSAGYEHFAFTYDIIFAPEHANAFMAGNTGLYEGPDPEAPEGAMTYNRRGSMYLKDGYWYCGGIGTG